MKRFLLFILVLFLSPFVVGQGASTPKEAWDGGNVANGGDPNQFWLMMDQDKMNNSTWEYRSSYFSGPGIPPAYDILRDPRQISLNELNSIGPISPTNEIRYAYDQYMTFGPLASCDSDFEEWYLIKAPSTGIIYIELDLATDHAINNAISLYKTLTLYEFNEVDIIGNLNDNYLGIIPPCSSNSYGAFKIVNTWNTNSNNSSVKLNYTNISKDYLLLRIGNNPALVFGSSEFTTYNLGIKTKNSTCSNALDFPISLDAFSSNTDKTDLNSSSELTKAYYDTRYDSVTTGMNDLKLPDTGNTGTKGMWFHVENITNDPVYAALCNVSPNAQMVIYKDNGGCPTLDDGIDPDNMIVGAEDQNTDLNDNLGVDVCLSDPNNPNNPVMRIDAPASSYYIYLFGDDGGSDFDFDFYFLNDGGIEENGGTILPVTWLSFDGYAIGKQNEIIWQTASEQQNNYFILEKSEDGENYSELARVEGAGNSAFENSYSFIDSSPYALTYYRISQVDWDGTIHSGPQTVVENNATINNFQVLSNPVETNSIQLSYYITKEESIQIDIYTVNGVKVYSENRLLMMENNNFTIPINNFRNGVYIMSIKTNSSNYTQKIIKNTLH